MPTRITIATYDEKHKQNLAKRAKKVSSLYDAAVKRLTQAAAPSLFDADKEQEFHFEDFPALKREMDALMQDLYSSLQTNIEDGDEESWTLANTKNDAMVESVIGKAKLPKQTVQVWKHPHMDALNAFIDRKEAGMGLSKRVWNLTQQFKDEMELALELGMGEGRSAAELSRDIRKYLKEPNKLFRRVRDKSGALRLSKAAAAYHPGRGVYRSSYKNALRMTATENNMAYRTADHTRWQTLPFVLGIEVRISNNHPISDICDEHAGRYPVEFKFTGWHPWCRCYAVSILAKQEEMDAYTKALIAGEDVSDWQFTGKVEQMPTEFTKWMKDNESRIAKAKSIPYFIKDNFKDGDPTKGLRWEGVEKSFKKAEPAVVKKPTAKEIAAKRHAARTKEQVADIQARWNESRNNAAIVAKAQRTMRIAERYPAHNTLKLRRALATTDYAKIAQITATERSQLMEWCEFDRKAIEARITLGNMQGINAGKRNYILHCINNVERALASKGRKAYGNAKEGIAELEKELNALMLGSKQPTFIERMDAGETTEQLVARLGKNCPPTLQNFAKIVNKLESDMDGEFTQAETKLFKDTMRDMFKKYDFATNTDARYLENILDEHLKCQKETKSSGGLLDVNRRTQFSEKTFGTSKGTKAKDFEKYGFLTDRDLSKREQADWYGGTTIRLKKDKINATFTIGDSLDDCDVMSPSLVTDPKINSLASQMGRMLWQDNATLKKFSIAAKTSVEKTCKALCETLYIELQYHGEVTANCIDSIVFSSWQEAKKAKAAIKKALALKIPCYYIQTINGKDSAVKLANTARL